jgi:hypothetical protein
MNTKKVLLHCQLGFNHYAEARRKQQQQQHFPLICFNRCEEERESQLTGESIGCFDSTGLLS